MEFIIWVFAAFGAIMFWKKLVKPFLLNGKIPYATERGLLAVKAANFIGMVEIAKTETVEEANKIVATFKSDDVSTFDIETAQMIIKDVYQGKQLPMIDHARKLGFRE